MIMVENNQKTTETKNYFIFDFVLVFMLLKNKEWK